MKIKKVGIKTGIDLVKDERIKQLARDKIFLKKAFHPSEISAGKLSSVFALKEAVFKALEIFPEWHEVEIKHKENGKTEIVLSEKIKPGNLISADSSVSHEGGFTIGIVVMLFSE